MQSIASRLEECGLTMHPEKSKIVYCKDSNRTERLSTRAVYVSRLYVSAEEGAEQHNAGYSPASCRRRVRMP